MFTRAGDFTVKIVEAVLAEPKFSKDPNAFDVALKVQAEDGQGDWWRGEMSAEQMPGKLAEYTRAQYTIRVLGDIGFEGGEDLSRLNELVGKTTTVHVEESKPNAEGKVFLNIKWIGGGSGNAPKAISMQDAAQRMAALMGSAPAPQAAPAMPSTPSVPQAQRAPVATGSPFPQRQAAPAAAPQQAPQSAPAARTSPFTPR